MNGAWEERNREERIMANGKEERHMRGRNKRE
jgi:hypothetical protein